MKLLITYILSSLYVAASQLFPLLHAGLISLAHDLSAVSVFWMFLSVLSQNSSCTLVKKSDCCDVSVLILAQKCRTWSICVYLCVFVCSVAALLIYWCLFICPDTHLSPDLVYLSISLTFCLSLCLMFSA